MTKLERIKAENSHRIHEEILKHYLGQRANRELVETIRNRVQNFMMTELCYIGSVVKLKVAVDKNGLIKTIDFTLAGKPVYDPLLPGLLNKAKMTGRRLKATVRPPDKRFFRLDYTVDYDWEGNNDVELTTPVGKPAPIPRSFSEKRLFRTYNDLKQCSESIRGTDSPKCAQGSAAGAKATNKSVWQKAVGWLPKQINKANRVVKNARTSIRSMWSDTKKWYYDRTVKNADNIKRKAALAYLKDTAKRENWVALTFGVPEWEEQNARNKR